VNPHIFVGYGSIELKYVADPMQDLLQLLTRNNIVFPFNLSLFLIFMTETISSTDEGEPRPKYILNKMRIYFIYSKEVWSITITKFKSNLYIVCKGDVLPRLPEQSLRQI